MGSFGRRKTGPGMIRLAPEGWPFVLPALGVTLVALLLRFMIPESSPGLAAAFGILAGVSGLLTAFVAYFFRNPVRRRRDASGEVLSPADGKVIQIQEVPEPDLFARPATRISIFLSVFNVHVQRAPITGRVALKVYKPGKFLAAWESKASEDNEQATLGLVSEDRRVMVRQIAGLVARRIVTDPNKGDLVPQGSRIGIIRFGSRVDLFLPVEWDVTCRVGDRVKGGLTTMARIPREDGPG
jgi:phosphatidylserine decarboxylase